MNIAEQLAIDRAKALFSAEYANVQAALRRHGERRSRSRRSATPGDTILGLELAHGGHLTHGMKLNFSGKLYNAVSYGVNPETFLVNMNVVARQSARTQTGRHYRGLVRVSSSPRFRGLPRHCRRGRCQAVGQHGALRRARRSGHRAPKSGPLRRCGELDGAQDDRRAPAADSSSVWRYGARQEASTRTLFPGQQGGPLMHVIAAKATAFKLAGTPEGFRDRQERTVRGAKLRWPTGSPRTGLPLWWPRRAYRWHRRPPRACRTGTSTGSMASRQRMCCTAVGITVNRNAVPFDPRDRRWSLPACGSAHRR